MYFFKQITLSLKYGFFKKLHTHSKLVKKLGKKCSTGQRFICTEVNSYKIHILDKNPKWNITQVSWTSLIHIILDDKYAKLLGFFLMVEYDQLNWLDILLILFSFYAMNVQLDNKYADCLWFFLIIEYDQLNWLDILKTVAFFEGTKNPAIQKNIYLFFHWNFHWKHQFECIKLA